MHIGNVGTATVDRTPRIEGACGSRCSPDALENFERPVGVPAVGDPVCGTLELRVGVVDRERFTDYLEHRDIVVRVPDCNELLGVTSDTTTDRIESRTLADGGRRDVIVNFVN